jgi:hypothetical protein
MQTHKSDRTLLGALLVAAALVALAAALLGPPRRTGGLAEQPSTFFTESYGTKATYLALQQMGWQLTRLRRPIDQDTLAGLDALAILQPTETLTEHEHDVLLGWVRDGHALLVAAGHASVTAVRKEKGGTVGSPPLRAWFGWVGTPPQPSGPRQLVRTRFEARTNGDLLEGIGELTAVGGERFDAQGIVGGPLASAPVEALWTDAAGVVAARVRLGAGMIVALADTYALTNEGLHETDSPLWLANLARELTRGEAAAVIAFDEYHAGFPYRDPSWAAITKLMLAEGWGPCVAQLLLLLVLALYARGVPFGRPLDVQRRRRRQHGEFTVAAGRLLHDAGATELARETLHRHYVVRARRVLHASDRVDPAALAATARAGGQPQLAELLAGGPGAARQRRWRHRDLLDWAQRIHRVLEGLEHEH